ncbi:hypothetical protein BGW36DRAFT_20912 [Talaromyces proteolyticus]|uniref:DUF7136 domain-containing protein n=1 Tax=Talaromyces proteolyticus TaxID=1131652 RepID=A0AAD4Q1T5_9EURO|nr:uncharacterized protein BGW36DRAFT_20912 [Talaromyces proteolyticus]KAH8705985.1 hypothetical protein BGW36DRAFT_20912 [Talaromyces proteolyticus]
MRAFNHVCPLAWAALMVGLMTAMGDATATASPGIFEVDALFPRNETYTPQALMPIVFALQNPALASPLVASMSWELWEGNNYTSPGSVTDGGFEFATLDFSSNDPFLVTRIVNTLAYPDGFWTLSWSLEIYNCSQSEHSTQSITVSNATVFTISRSGRAPDLVAATSADMCGTADGYAFNVTSFGDTCGVLGSSPTTNSCAATIDPAAASSIYAAATASACSPLYRPQNPNITCPTSTSKSSASSADAAGRSRMAAASTLFTLLATLTALIHLG